MNKLVLSFLVVFSLLFSYETSFAFGTPVKVSTMEEVYETGKNIAQGIAEGFIIGLEAVDGKLQYKITHKNDTYKYKEHKWPVIKTFIELSGEQKTNIVLILFLEASGDCIVGTVQAVVANGKVINSPLTKTMYVETDEGIEQVAIKNGKLIFVE